MVHFKNRILMVGFGSVGKCVLPLLLRHVDAPCRNITVVDFADKHEAMKPWIARGVKYSQEKINPINITKVLAKHVSAGGMIIDLSWNIDCLEMLNWCHSNKVLYVNTSVEEWDPYAAIHQKTPFQKSLYYKQMEIRNMVSRWNNESITAVLDHGANPGLISHFTKRALVDIAHRMVADKAVPARIKKGLKRCLHERDYARLAMEAGVKVIHVSERDTQSSGRPRQVDEFVGTWSIEGLREEGTAPAELGWGTHEQRPPIQFTRPPYGPKNQIFFSRMGMNTWVRSWVPYCEIIGMIIRHGESFSISDKLTVWKGNRVIYRPTVHYAYMPCDDTIASLHELRARNYELQTNQRIMGDEVSQGDDTLGALVMGHRYNSWWTGSVLSIGESRRLIPHQNATTVQVAIGVVTSVMWMIENPHKGVCVPDELPYDYILERAKPYLGRLVSEPSDWTPFKNYQIFFKENPHSFLDKKNPWSFRNFLFKH
jgi:homospermidine synthase